MKNRKFGMAGVGSANGEMDFLTVPTKITPVKQMMAELQSDDEEPGLGYTHTLLFSRILLQPEQHYLFLTRCTMKIDGKPPYNPRRFNRYTTALLQEVGYQGKGDGEDSNENTGIDTFYFLPCLANRTVEWG
uniref:Uncharacterized protein n=1 Tax=Anopheles coluzzii TaxID=1518534 RepID=A0A8W7PVM8_ANOCL